MELFEKSGWPVSWRRLLSTKTDGPLPPSSELGVSPLMANRKNFLVSHGIETNQIVSARLCHGTHIITVSESNGGQVIENTDGLSTNRQNIFLAVTVADCVPIYLYDPIHHAVAVAHAGWKGMVAGMPTAMIQHLQQTYGTKPSEVLAGIGPCIQVCHFEVGLEVAKKFGAWPAARIMKSGHEYIDLPAVATAMLTSAGVPRKNIISDGRCTMEDQNLYSFRRDKNLSAGVMTAVTGMTV